MNALTEGLAAGAVLGASYCLGGLHGLWLAWSQEARMDRWAAKVDRAQRKLHELEERGAEK